MSDKIMGTVPNIWTMVISQYVLKLALFYLMTQEENK